MYVFRSYYKKRICLYKGGGGIHLEKWCVLFC